MLPIFFFLQKIHARSYIVCVLIARKTVQWIGAVCECWKNKIILMKKIDRYSSNQNQYPVASLTLLLYETKFACCSNAWKFQRDNPKQLPWDYLALTIFNRLFYYIKYIFAIHSSVQFHRQLVQHCVNACVWA